MNTIIEVTVESDEILKLLADHVEKTSGFKVVSVQTYVEQGYSAYWKVDPKDSIQSSARYVFIME